MKKLIKKIFGKEKLTSNIEKAFVNQYSNSDTTIIHHYCPHTYNAGDHFVIQSIRKHLIEEIDNALFIPKPCANNRGWGKPTRLTGENITFSNKYAHAVVIGGSDQYNGWSLRIKKDEIGHLIPPLYTIGLGISSKDIGKPPNVDSKYHDDIIAMHDITKLASVRDNLTLEFLVSLGIKNVELTGCPATFLFNHEFDFREKGKVMLTFPFPVMKRNSDKFQIILNYIQNLISYLKSKEIDYLIICHDDRDVMVAQDIFGSEKLFFSNYPEHYYELYANALMTIGTRLHASILCAGLGTPFLNINVDSRGKGFSKTFELEDWNIDYNSAHLLEQTIETLNLIKQGNIERFDQFYKTKELYYAKFKMFIKNIAADIKKRL